MNHSVQPVRASEIRGQNARLHLQVLFEENSRTLFVTAYRITGNVMDAEDVLQSVFVRLLERDDLAQEKGNPSAYLRRAAINAALDIMRSRKRRKNVSLTGREETLRGSGRERPDDVRAADELREWLRERIAALPARAAEIFVLRFFEDCNNEEIARLLGTSPGTVAVTLHRTRIRLQKEFESFLGGTP